MSVEMKRTRPGDPTVAVAYLRVSTEDQKLGPEAQRATIEAWASKQGLRVVGWHVDQISGGSELDDRPGLGAALGELRAIGAGVLVIAKRDRLARDSGIAIAIERAAKACGAVIVSADGTGNGDRPEDEFMRRILDAAAAYERALIRTRTKAALAVKRRQGLRVGGIPLGYRLADDGKALVLDEREAMIVQRVRDLRAAGLSMMRISQQLAADGFAPRAGTKWYPEQIARMLSRSAA